MKQRAKGFTLIEVMIALAVMTVGAMGIMGLQRATMRGNAEARELTVATDVTRKWVERLRRDSLTWNLQGMPPGTYLSQIGAPGTVPAWIVPPVPPAPATESPATDYLGNDVPPDSPDVAFCTHVMLSWVAPNNMIRADVRTWWYRRGTRANAVVLDCDGNAVGAVSAQLATAGDLRAVYASTLVRWTSLNVQP